MTLSDSDGFVHYPAGIDQEKLEFVKELKEVRRGRIREYVERFPAASYHDGERPWSVPCDVALPCATQNELDGVAARTLLDHGVRLVGEGANMPVTPEGVRTLLDAKVLYAPAKAANAGGVAVSGLEQSQNTLRLSWSRDEVDQRLRSIIRAIHERCVEYGTENGFVNYQRGGNIAGFVRVADAMLAHAKPIAAELVEAVGGTALDAGGLEHAAYIEAMGAVVIRALFGGADPTTTFPLAVADGTRVRTG